MRSVVSPFTKETSVTDEPNIKRGLVFRSVRCVVVGLIASAIIIPSTAWMLDKFERQQKIKASKEREAKTLGDGKPPSAENFYPVRVLPQPPSVSGFVVLGVDDESNTLRDDELVLGVVIDGQARAWPLNVMTGPEREVFNDKLGGRRIAATW
jgi:hypothetical protein